MSEGFNATQREIEILEARKEIGRLRKGIQDYLEGNYGPNFPTKHDTCPHTRYGWEDCGNCIDEHFTALLANTPADHKSET